MSSPIVPYSTVRSWSNPSWWHALAVLPWVIGLVFLVHEGMVDREIASRQQRAVGIVTAHEPENHDQYRYTFSVSGKAYSGLDGAKKEAPKIGSQVQVFYDPKDPSKNGLTDFAERSLEVTGPVPLTSFGIGAVFFYILWKRRQVRERTIASRS